MVGNAGIAQQPGGGDEETAAPTPAGAASAERSRPAPRRIDSSGLMAGAREIEIEHRGEIYRLRCTNKGKLILTK